jgi:hypothetical protein
MYCIFQKKIEECTHFHHKEIKSATGNQWFMPVILTSWEAEIGKIKV